MDNFYDGTKLLNMLDINGNRPEIYMTVGNRTGGKTTYFDRLSVNRFLKRDSQFLHLTRYKTDLTGCIDDFFNKISPFFDIEFTPKKYAGGKYWAIKNGEKIAGYFAAINSADAIKRFSETFSHVGHIFIDEFQSESFNYCPMEFEKFISIHTSVARGHGAPSRYVPVYMASNPFDLLNPYFKYFKISGKINENTHYLRGDGWVLEHLINEQAKNAQLESAFNRAVAGRFTDYNILGKYTNNMCLIEKISGKSTYVATLNINDSQYGVRIFDNKIYISNKIDKNFSGIYVTDYNATNDGIYLSRSSDLFVMLYTSLQLGKLFFDSIETKSNLFDILV